MSSGACRFDLGIVRPRDTPQGCPSAVVVTGPFEFLERREGPAPQRHNEARAVAIDRRQHAILMDDAVIFTDQAQDGAINMLDGII